MSQADWERSFDAKAFGLFKDAGIGDAALFKADGAGAGVPCTVLVTRNEQFFDDVQQVAGTRTIVALMKAEVPASKRGDTVTIGSEVLTLDARVGVDDTSRIHWVVT